VYQPEPIRFPARVDDAHRFHDHIGSASAPLIGQTPKGWKVRVGSQRIGKRA
jgi:hypothetical protein